MTAIFLSVIAIGVIIFFIISRSLTKFLPNKRIRHASFVAYLLQFLGLLGLMVYHVDFLSTPQLRIQLEANSPDFIKALAELLWPITAMLAIFWFLPQILDFLRDPGKSGHVLAAISGRYNPQEQHTFIEAADIEKIPAYENLSQAHKDLISLFKSQLSNFPANEQENRLLIHAADQQLSAEFGYIYYLIFGSQIEALQLLNTNEKSDLTSFYETHKRKVENIQDAHDPSFRDWSNFLLEHNLVTANENKFSITNKGKEFLRFLKNRDYHVLKAF